MLKIVGVKSQLFLNTLYIPSYKSIIFAGRVAEGRSGKSEGDREQDPVGE